MKFNHAAIFSNENHLVFKPFKEGFERKEGTATRSSKINAFFFAAC